VKTSLRITFVAALATAALVGANTRAEAQEMERNFAGSAQLDYLVVPTTIDARPFSFDGFTTELAVKLAVDFTPNISANVKLCYGCHGFETDMAFVDLRVADQLNFRIGRMNPAFGDFPLRHDPANHRANSKPLPYDMGRMLRRAEWNMSVLPSPYVDNGLEVNGTQWFGNDVQLDYAVYVVSGLKGNNDALDLDFIQSRSGTLYYVDNNSRARLRRTRRADPRARRSRQRDRGPLGHLRRLRSRRAVVVRDRRRRPVLTLRRPQPPRGVSAPTNGVLRRQ
jgi:hypothetical protein